jgi:hypothetical protein
MNPIIVEGDWVLICETNEKGMVETVLDEGERFIVAVAATTEWPYPKRLHVMIEKVRKIKPPKPEKPEIKWHQITLI